MRTVKIKRQPDEAKHEAILKAATHLFLKHGFAGTSMDEVALLARVTPHRRMALAPGAVLAVQMQPHRHTGLDEDHVEPCLARLAPPQYRSPPCVPGAPVTRIICVRRRAQFRASD